MDFYLCFLRVGKRFFNDNFVIFVFSQMRLCA